ncbi:hypothetical protein [Arthrobacter sp. M2012083]|nr:hypothetical protein [Arthrobacter sp. M2012083]
MAIEDSSIGEESARLAGMTVFRVDMLDRDSGRLLEECQRAFA